VGRDAHKISVTFSLRNRWSAHAAGIDDRAGITFEALAQFDDLRLVGQERSIVVGDLVGEDRQIAGGRRYVATTRPSSGGDLLVRLEQPSQEQFRRVRVRRVLENGARQRPDRSRADGREMS
jgi:hypothetical protein